MAMSITAVEAEATSPVPPRAGDIGQTGWTQYLVPFASGFTVLLASLVNFLIFNDYPLLRGDVLLVAGGIALTCLFMALLYPGQRRLVRAAMEGFLIGLFVDLNADHEILAAGAGLATLMFVYLARKSILPFALMIGASIVVTALLGLGTRQPWIETRSSSPGPVGTAAQLPAIVHIILDEHIGIEGLPASNPETQAIKTELRDFYQSRGFALFGRAYSEHMRTVNAIPDMLNYGNRGGSGAGRDGVQVGPTAHFEKLRRQGYNLHLFQSSFVDFCTGAGAATCTTYVDSSLRPTLDAPLLASERAKLIVLKFAGLSSLAKWMDMTNLIERQGLSSSVVALSAAQKFAEQVRSARPGEVHFAHLLIPHYPYVVDRNCRLLPASQWRQRKWSRPIEEREVAYFEQLRCSLRQIDRILDAVAKSPAGPDAIVVIHGDHGSRITDLDPNTEHRGRYTKAQMVAAFNTLFAVRGPKIAPGYDESPARVSHLLEDLGRSEFGTLPVDRSDDAPSVVLEDLNWKPRARVPFPATW